MPSPSLSHHTTLPSFTLTPFSCPNNSSSHGNRRKCILYRCSHSSFLSRSPAPLLLSFFASRHYYHYSYDYYYYYYHPSRLSSLPVLILVPKPARRRRRRSEKSMNQQPVRLGVNPYSISTWVLFFPPCQSISKSNEMKWMVSIHTPDVPNRPRKRHSLMFGQIKPNKLQRPFHSHFVPYT